MNDIIVSTVDGPKLILDTGRYHERIDIYFGNHLQGIQGSKQQAMPLTMLR